MLSVSFAHFYHWMRLIFLIIFICITPYSKNCSLCTFATEPTILAYIELLETLTFASEVVWNSPLAHIVAVPAGHIVGNRSRSTLRAHRSQVSGTVVQVGQGETHLALVGVLYRVTVYNYTVQVRLLTDVFSVHSLVSAPTIHRN